MILRTTGSIFSATVDTGSPQSFIKKPTADLLKKKDKFTRVLLLEKHPIKTKYVDYNHQAIKLFGTLIINKHSNGWVAENAQFLISENRTKCLLGLDIQPKISITTTQVKPTYSQVKEIKTAESAETEESQFWKNNFMGKYNNVFSRLGRSKNDKVFTLLNHR